MYIDIYTRTRTFKKQTSKHSVLQFIRQLDRRRDVTNVPDGRYSANSSSDLVLVAARAELLVSDRKTDVPLLHRHAVRVESDYNRSGRVRCNAKKREKKNQH